MRIRTATLVGVLAVAMGVAGCGPADPAPPGPPPPESSGSPPADHGAAASTVLVTVGSATQMGVVLTGEGHVAINGAVLTDAADAAPDADDSDDAPAVTVTLGDGDSRDATVVGVDPLSKVAVIEVGDPAGLAPAEFADSELIAAGDEVRVVGELPESAGSTLPGTVVDPRVAVGGVGMLAVDVASRHGGPVTTPDGGVIGLLTAVSTVDGAETGYALPANLVRRVAEQLIIGEPVVYPYLGVSVDSAAGDGALVVQVADGSPAAQAGLRVGDVIVRLGDTPIAGPDDVLARVQSARVGEELPIGYTRDGAEQATTATLAAAAPSTGAR